MAENYSRRVKKILRKSGCVFVRQGRGDHEIWETPKGTRFMVDNNIKNRTWANYTLKAASLPKAF